MEKFVYFFLFWALPHPSLSYLSEPRVVRTSEERFYILPQLGYPWNPNYITVDIDGKPPLRMHYIDEGKIPMHAMLFFIIYKN